MQCVAVCHAEAAHQQMLAVALMYSDGSDFQPFDVLNFEAAESSAEVGDCSIDNPCPPNNFCNFDGGSSGRCEACTDCGAPDGCFDCGLPDAGAADCRDMCTGTYLDGDRVLCSLTNVCPIGHFCNFDHGYETVSYTHLTLPTKA